MENRRIRGSILRQIALLFALGILAAGLITYITYESQSFLFSAADPGAMQSGGHLADAGDLARIRPNNDIGRLSEDVSSLAEEIGAYLDRIETITAEKERIRTELFRASCIQADMLPHIFLPFPEREEFDIYAALPGIHRIRSERTAETF